MKSHIKLGLIIIIAVITIICIGIKYVKADYNEVVKYGKANLPIRIYDIQIDNLKNRGFSTGAIIDLLSIRNKECGRKDGLCYGFTGDLGFYQINHIHKKQYKKSKELMKSKKVTELWNYQSNYAYKLWTSPRYEELCGKEAHESIGREFTQKNYIACKSRLYNGSAKKQFYGDSLVFMRPYIEKYILDYLTK